MQKMSEKQYKEYCADLKLYRQVRVEEAKEDKNSLARILLDSSLISQTSKKKYTIKVVECNEYYQVYYYNKLKQKKDKNLESDEEERKKRIHDTYLFKKENITRKDEKKLIEYKNIMRSKLSLQRLVKANEKDFKTFITLTFAENLKSVEEANKYFNNFLTKLRQYIKRTKKEFSLKYVCVLEFQKRGAVHYHLLTNLDIKENSDIIILQKDKKTQYDVRFWDYGFSSVFSMQDINVVGYISKYMTKDIDNRLFAKRRYLYSQNLNKVSEFYVDLSDDKDFLTFAELISKVEAKYEHSYLDYYEDTIDFVEYKLKEN